MNNYVNSEKLKNLILADMAKAEREERDTSGYTDALFHLKTLTDRVNLVRCVNCLYYVEMQDHASKGIKARYCCYYNMVPRSDGFCNEGIIKQ